MWILTAIKYKIILDSKQCDILSLIIFSSVSHTLLNGTKTVACISLTMHKCEVAVLMYDVALKSVTKDECSSFRKVWEPLI
jgi:hypothetical protein